LGNTLFLDWGWDRRTSLHLDLRRRAIAEQTVLWRGDSASRDRIERAGATFVVIVIAIIIVIVIIVIAVAITAIIIVVVVVIIVTDKDQRQRFGFSVEDRREDAE
jgi:Flp pilus assembly protein TadB